MYKYNKVIKLATEIKYYEKKLEEKKSAFNSLLKGSNVVTSRRYTSRKSFSKKVAEGMKRVWASRSPEQRKAIAEKTRETRLKNGTMKQPVAV